MRGYVITAVLLYFTGATAVNAGPMPDCAELLLNRCQSCHYLDRVCRQVGEKSKRRWKATLKRMVQRRGVALSTEEQEFLLGCLLAPAPDIKKECGK
jgi:hypothetical protein